DQRRGRGARRGRRGGGGREALLATVPQVALDLLDQRPGPGLLVLVVVPLLEGRHVRRGLLVLLHQLGDLALVRRSGDLQLGGRHPQAEQPGGALEERERRLG